MRYRKDMRHIEWLVVQGRRAEAVDVAMHGKVRHSLADEYGRVHTRGAVSAIAAADMLVLFLYCSELLCYHAGFCLSLLLHSFGTMPCC